VIATALKFFSAVNYFNRINSLTRSLTHYSLTRSFDSPNLH